MRIADMDWRMIEDWTRSDDRVLLPLGSTEQHAGLSLMVDTILSEKVAVEAAEPLGVPVYPSIPFGIAPYFQAFPGSITLRVATYVELVRDVLDSLKRSGFRRVLIVNGHGGNQPAAALAQEWMMDNPDCRVRFHDWWRAPQTLAAVQATDPQGSHANWMENFPWTRLATTQPDQDKPMVDTDMMKTHPPFESRQMLEDGSFGGRSQRSDNEMLAIWQVAVAETRSLIETW
jgi:creatinine amidohydrolase